MKKQRVARTRNGGTWTNSEFFGRLRSSLRKMSQFWRPAITALNRSRIPCKGPNGQKWAYMCAGCGDIFKRKDVQIDHKVPAGSLTCLADLPGFVERLLPEDPGAYQILCTACHKAKTAKQRNGP